MVWLVFVVCVSISLVWFVCAVLVFSCCFVVFGVYGLSVVCCVAVCCFIGLSRVYVLLLVCVRFRCFCCGLNASPACDCLLYVPSSRCSFLFV